MKRVEKSGREVAATNELQGGREKLKQVVGVVVVVVVVAVVVDVAGSVVLVVVVVVAAAAATTVRVALTDWSK